MMPNQILRILTSGRFRPLATLWDDVSNESPDEFPEVIFVEPWYTDGPHHNLSRDDHAPSSVVGGQQFVNEVYRSIRVNPNWAGTVMVLTYDQHGGFFDHVSPPRVVTNPPDNTHSNPGFSYLGVRVPALVISPFVSSGKVYNKRLDHTSILKFIGEKFGKRNGKVKGYSPLVDARDVYSLYDVLDLDTARAENAVAAFPLSYEYLDQPVAPAGYLPSSGVPPSILAQGFKFGLDTIRNHPNYNNGYFDDLLRDFAADPVIHLT